MGDPVTKFTNREVRALRALVGDRGSGTEGPIEGTTGTFSGAVTAGSVAATGAVTGASFNGVGIVTGSADPTAASGVAATAPALYFRTGTADVYLKTGSGDTAWSLLLRPDANIVMAAGKDITMGSGGQLFFDPGTAANPGIASRTETNNGLYRLGPNLYGFACNGSAFWYVDPSAGFVVNTTLVGSIAQFSNYIQLAQIANPSAPAAGFTRIYGADNGGGKTQLRALFDTGVALQIQLEA